MSRTELSAQQSEFFARLKNGTWDFPPGIKNLGIRPDLWLKEVSYGYTRYEWPNDGSRDINEGRVFGGWVAGLSDHIVSMTMASALEDGASSAAARRPAWWKPTGATRKAGTWPASRPPRRSARWKSCADRGRWRQRLKANCQEPCA